MRLTPLLLFAAVGCGDEHAPRRERSAPRTAAPAAAIDPVRIDPPAGLGAVGPSLAADGDSVVAVWVEPGAGSEAKRVRFARWRDGRWGAPATVTEGLDVLSNWADFPIVAASDGHVLVTIPKALREGVEATHVEVARSDDGGATWTIAGRVHDDESETEHGFPSLLPESEGARAFFLDGREMATGGPMTLRAALVGPSAIAPSEGLDARVCECCGTGAAATDEGPVVVYRDRTEEEIRDVWIVRREGEGWAAPRPVHVDGWRVPGCPVNGPRVAADGRRVAVAWFTYADRVARVRVAFSEDGGRTFGNPIDVAVPEGRRAPVGRVDLVLDGGDALVSFLDSDREEAAVRVRRVGADGRVGEAVRIGGTFPGRESGFPRMVRLGEKVFVAWKEAPPVDLLRAAWLPVSAVAPLGSAPPPAAPAAADTLLAVGSQLPDLEARGLDGAPVSLGSRRGKPTLVNFWATWCEPCRHELPALSALRERFATRGLEVVGVSMDAQKTTQQVKAFAERRRIPFPVWHDAQDRASRAFGVDTLPASFLFDRSGRLVWRVSGAVRADDPDVLRAIESALRGT